MCVKVYARACKSVSTRRCTDTVLVDYCLRLEEDALVARVRLRSGGNSGGHRDRDGARRAHRRRDRRQGDSRTNFAFTKFMSRTRSRQGFHRAFRRLARFSLSLGIYSARRAVTRLRAVSSRVISIFATDFYMLLTDVIQNYSYRITPRNLCEVHSFPVVIAPLAPQTRASFSVRGSEFTAHTR